MGLDTILWLSAWAAVPFFHWAWIHESGGGLAGDAADAAVWRKSTDIVATYAIAAVGLAFYVTRFPETRCCSGRCDLFGASHQIWHVCVFLGMAYWLSVSVAYYRSAAELSCSESASNFGPPDLLPDPKLAGDTASRMLAAVFTWSWDPASPVDE